ncbi:MAG: 4-vinyl reductase [Chloroflexi bacterium]|nr:4-vinyl reductase [Chloroflexota bacterium]
MEDVMGKNGLDALLVSTGLGAYIAQPPPDTLARQFDFAYMSALSEGLEEMYGAKGGRGIALRVGRACFSKGLKDFGALAGVGAPAFQSLPVSDKTQLGLKALASIFSHFSDQASSVADKGDTFHFIVDVSPMAWGRVSDRPVCHALTGIIQESLRWATGGFEHHVQEIACHATGAEECIFKVNKKPIGQL